ncbi:hypothetical protein D3C80_883820 [compost metagenome]
MQLGLLQQLLQILAADVQQLLMLVQGKVDVLGGQPGARLGIRRLVTIGRHLAAIGITAPQGAVVEQPQAQQQQGVEQHRQQHIAHPQRPDPLTADDGGQGHGPAGRVQAAGEEHGGDGQHHRQRRGKGHVRHQAGTQYPHQGRDPVAHQDGPGLGQGARRGGKQQHGGGPHGGDQPVHLQPQPPLAEPGGAQQSDEGAEGAVTTLFEAGIGRYRQKIPELHPAPEDDNIYFKCAILASNPGPIPARQGVTPRLIAR